LGLFFAKLACTVSILANAKLEMNVLKLMISVFFNMNVLHELDKNMLRF